MHFSTQCPQCLHKFKLREALCDDWRDPEKAFGCPACGTFLVREVNTKKFESIKIFIFAAIGTVSGMMLPDLVFFGDDSPLLVLTAALFTGITLYFLTSPLRIKRRFKISPYRRQEEATRSMHPQCDSV